MKITTKGLKHSRFQVLDVAPDRIMLFYDRNYTANTDFDLKKISAFFYFNPY